MAWLVFKRRIPERAEAKHKGARGLHRILWGPLETRAILLFRYTKLRQLP